MLIRDLAKIEWISAPDGCLVKEWMSPLREKMESGCSFAYAKVEEGKETALHALKTSSEAYVVLEGEGVLTIGAESEKVVAGQAIYIPAGEPQKIRNIGKGDLVFICIVSPPWRKEDEAGPGA